LDGPGVDAGTAPAVVPVTALVAFALAVALITIRLA
jgi:hypothetical protein